MLVGVGWGVGVGVGADMTTEPPCCWWVVGVGVAGSGGGVAVSRLVRSTGVSPVEGWVAGGTVVVVEAWPVDVEVLGSVGV